MDNIESRHIVIAGAGIAGLTAAIAFAKRGYPVKLFEQAERLDAVGAGIQLSPNATRILREIGVLDRLLPAAVRPEAVVLKDASTLRELARVPLGQAAEMRWQAPYLVAHRADVQDALMASAETFGIEIVTGARVTGFMTGRDGISATFAPASQTPDIKGSLLVGADGVWSSIRERLRDRTASAGSRFSGEIAWRATIGADGAAGRTFTAIGAANCVTTFLHSGFHMVAYPVSNGAAFNLVAFTKGDRIAEGWSGTADPRILIAAMRGTAQELVRLAEDVGRWMAWPLHTVGQEQPWTSSEGVALIGDAAHAMTPFAAQGAAMAIEDAATLAECVAAFPADAATGLRVWENLRRPRVARVARRGALNHFAWHASGPVAMARNLFLKMRPPEKLAADLDWLYGWQQQKIIRR